MFRLERADQWPDGRCRAEPAECLGGTVDPSVVGTAQCPRDRLRGHLGADVHQPLDREDPRLQVGVVDGHGDQRRHGLRPADVRQRLDVVCPHAGHPFLAERRGQRRHGKRVGDFADLLDGCFGLPGIVEPLPQPFEPDRPFPLREVHAVGPLDQFDLLHRPPHAAVAHEAAGSHQLLRAQALLCRGVGNRGGLVANDDPLQRCRHHQHCGDDPGTKSHGMPC